MRQEEAARLLGLKPDSSLEEIKAAYKTISSDVNVIPY
jgi:curved DNA-binding protein CbpA